MDLRGWRQALANVSEGTKAGLQAVVVQMRGRINADVTQAANAVREMDATLRRWELVLGRWRGLLSQPGATEADRAAYQRSVAAHTTHSLPFYGDMRSREGADASQARAEIDRAPIGVAWVPVIILGGVLVVGMVGTSWALAHRADAQALLAQAEVETAELAARLEAMRAGTVLQNSTLRPTAPPPGGGGGGGWEWGEFEKAVAVGFGLATVLGVGGVVLWNRS